MKILIIEDDLLFQRNYQLLLSNQGHKIELCANRAQAEAALQQDLYDVVLLDQNLDEPSRSTSMQDPLPPRRRRRQVPANPCRDRVRNI